MILSEKTSFLKNNFNYFVRLFKTYLTVDNVFFTSFKIQVESRSAKKRCYFGSLLVTDNLKLTTVWQYDPKEMGRSE